MKPHHVTIIRVVEFETDLFADDAAEAERLAQERMPSDGRDWTEVHREVVVSAEVKS